jgi:hypothetical protein
LNAFSNFLREAIPAGQATPELVPMLMGMIKFGVGAFKQANSIEGMIDTALQQLNEKSKQMAQNPQPSAEEMKMKAETQAQQAKLQADMQIAQMQAQMEAQKQQHDAQLKMQELAAKDQLEKWKNELDSATKIMVARIGANPGADIPLIEAQTAAAEHLTAELGDNVRHAMNQMAESHNNMANMHGEAMDKLHNALQTIAAPKRVVRGPDGRAVGVELAQ